MKATLINVLPQALQHVGDTQGTEAELRKAQALLNATIEQMDEDALLAFFAEERHEYAEFDNLHLPGKYLKRLTFVALSEIHEAHGGKFGVDSQIKRILKCIEIAIRRMTDEEFGAFLSLPELIEIQTNPVALQAAAQVYAEEVQPLEKIDESITQTVLSPYRKFLQGITPSTLQDFCKERSYLKSFIRRRSAQERLYSHPAILIVFFLAEHEGDDLWHNWPMDLRILEDIFSLLGISTARY